MGIGEISEGKFKGRRFIIPSVVWIEDGVFLNGAPKFVLGCIKHNKLNIPGKCVKCEPVKY